MLTQPSKKKQKAQSAMEYLMTYGWAILIIAVVLGALFSLGVFNGGAGLGNACVASSGYLCQTASYSHTTGDIFIAQVGQNTGTTWSSANFIYVPQGQLLVSGLPAPLDSPAAITVNGNLLYGGAGTTLGLISGQTVQLTFPVNGVSTNSLAALASPLSVGQATTGTIWAQYTTSGSPTTFQYAQIATINLKAT